MSEEICDKIYSYLEEKKIREDRIYLDTVSLRETREVLQRKTSDNKMYSR